MHRLIIACFHVRKCQDVKSDAMFFAAGLTIAVSRLWLVSDAELIEAQLLLQDSLLLEYPHYSELMTTCPSVDTAMLHYIRLTAFYARQPG